MTNRNNSIDLKDIVLTLLIASMILLVALTYIPSLMILLPVAFVLIGLKYDNKTSMITFFAFILLSLTYLDSITLLGLAIMYLPLIIFFNISIREKIDPLKILAITTLVFIVSNLVVISLEGKILSSNILAEIQESFKISLDEELKELPNLDKFEVEYVIKTIFDYVLVVLPSLFIIFSFIGVYINYYLINKIARKRAYPYGEEVGLYKFKLPKNIVRVSLLMTLAAFIIKKLGVLKGESLLANIIIIFWFLFFLQGLGVISSRLIRKGRGRFRRIVTLIIITTIIPLNWLIVFIGISDNLLDYRSR